MPDHLTRSQAEQVAILHAEHSLGYRTARVLDCFALPLPGAWSVLLEGGADAGPARLEFAVVVGRGADGQVGVAQDDVDPTHYMQAKARHGKRARWAA